MTVALTLTLAAGRAGACAGVDYERAARAERAHRLGAAIERRTALLACADGERSVDNRLALAADHASVGDFDRAAEVAEFFTRGRSADARVAAAVGSAVTFRIALGELDRAEADARWLLSVSVAAGDATEHAFALGAAYERSGRWADVVRWDRWLLERNASPERWQAQVRALTGIGRAQERSGDRVGARRSREAAVLRGHRATADDAVAPDLSEARFRAAEVLVAGCPQVDELRASEPGRGARRAWHLWVERRISPWIRQRQACNDAVAGRLVEVTQLHVPRWEVAAVAVLATLYRQMAQVFTEFRYPPDVRGNPDLIDAYGSML